MLPQIRAKTAGATVAIEKLVAEKRSASSFFGPLKADG
jgi:hypothetical protein